MFLGNSLKPLLLIPSLITHTWASCYCNYIKRNNFEGMKKNALMNANQEILATKTLRFGKLLRKAYEKQSAMNYVRCNTKQLVSDIFLVFFPNKLLNFIHWINFNSCEYISFNRLISKNMHLTIWKL